MQRNRISTAVALCAALLISTAAPCSATPLSATPQDTPSAGFGLVDEAYPGAFLTATLDNGDVVSFDGIVVARYDDSGNHIVDLATMPGFLFGSFLLASADESHAVLGESTNGDLFRIDLSAGGATLLTNLAYNYAADFETLNSVVVSAATCGFGCGNEVFRVDTVSGATTVIANVGGSSGPLSVAANGDVVYGRVSDTFSLGDHSVIRFDAADLTGSPVATELDATVIGTGFDGAGAMVIDPVTGDIYMAENDFSSGINRVRRVKGNQSVSPIVVDGSAGLTIGNLEFDVGDGVAIFRAFQPESGGGLRYNTTDFGSLKERKTLLPTRPVLNLSGPGSTGAGTMTTTVIGGAPAGFAVLLYGPTSLFNPAESAIYLAALEAPLFTGLDLGTVTIDTNIMGLNAAGAGQLMFPLDGSLVGLVTSQAIVLDSSFKLVQVSEAASF